MSKLANTDNSHFSGSFTSTEVPTCSMKGGKGKRTRRMTHKRRYKKSRKGRISKKRSHKIKLKFVQRKMKKTKRRKMKGGSYTLSPSSDIKMGPKGGLGQVMPSDAKPDLSLISKSSLPSTGEISNTYGQAGGKRKQRKGKKSKKMKGGTGPSAFGYGIGKFTSIAEANPIPIKAYNSCQKDNYVH
jgi:hypothetical protein